MAGHIPGVIGHSVDFDGDGAYTRSFLFYLNLMAGLHHPYTD